MKNRIRREYVKKSKCKYCKSTENLTIDHKTPFFKGGKDDPKNYQTLCKRCNQTKSALTHGEVLHYFNWFLAIQADREKAGAKPYVLR